METVSDLKELLQEQFGPFIRDNRYQEAFARAMDSIKRLDVTTPKIDVFYLFLHHLVIELFDEIDRLSVQLNSNNNDEIKHQ